MAKHAYFFYEKALTRSVISFFLLPFFLLGILMPVYSQPSLSGVAVNLEVAESDINEGHILSISKDGFKKAATSYDVSMFGVVAAFPILSLEPKTDNTRSVVSSGAALVRVKADPDPLKVGDFVTSSETAGVGQKATVSGFVIGKALADWEDSSKEGLIPVEVNIGYADVVGGVGGRGLKGFWFGLINNPLNLRYALALIAGVLIFLAATFAFVKFMNTGLAALGRNPLAKGTILGGMVLSGIVVAVLALAGAAVVVAIIGIGPLKIFG